jgi:regulator of sigma E protease
LDAAAGKTVELTIQREASKTPLVLSVRLRQPIGCSPPVLEDSPATISSLGLAYRVLNRVERVVEGSPAAKAGLLPDDLITRAKVIPPDKETSPDQKSEQREAEVPLTDEKRNWPLLVSVLERTLPGTTVELTFLRQDKEHTARMSPVEAADWFSPDRGFLFEPKTFPRKAETAAAAFALGGRQTLDDLTTVFRMLRALGTSQVSPRLLMGPIGMFEWAMNSADQGSTRLLLFLAFISANLAVVNFLPIPLLDGGLMMFLIYELIRRKPANEHVQVVLTYIGLILILALMVWVCGLDMLRLFGWR